MDDARPLASTTERRILLVEDEESLRHALSKSLKRMGWRVEAASTGREAVERLRAGPFDAVVTDVRLPDLSGLDVVAFATETTPTTPVVVMTAFGTVETALVAMKRGARDFVTKPFETSALVAILEREIGRASSDEARLRVEVERRFAPGEFEGVERELRRHPEPAPGPATAPGASALPKATDDPLALKDAQRRFEIRYVEDLLSRTGGNVAAAARLASISRPNFHKKLKVLGVDPSRFKRAHRRGKTAGL
jgi:DNA-binding NtrC family response regulator